MNDDLSSFTMSVVSKKMQTGSPRNTEMTRLLMCAQFDLKKQDTSDEVYFAILSLNCWLPTCKDPKRLLLGRVILPMRPWFS